jgi:hypothetical protein
MLIAHAVADLGVQQRQLSGQQVSTIPSSSKLHRKLLSLIASWRRHAFTIHSLSGTPPTTHNHNWPRTHRPRNAKASAFLLAPKRSEILDPVSGVVIYLTGSRSTTKDPQKAERHERRERSRSVVCCHSSHTLATVCRLLVLETPNQLIRKL